MPRPRFIPFRVALVGDYNPVVLAHQAIPEALRLASVAGGVEVEPFWIHTAAVTGRRRTIRQFRRHLVRSRQPLRK